VLKETSKLRAATPSSRPLNPLLRPLVIAVALLVMAWSASALAQSCPYTPYVDCGSGTCCPGADSCCDADPLGCCRPGSTCGRTGCVATGGGNPGGGNCTVSCGNNTCCQTGFSCCGSQCCGPGSICNGSQCVANPNATCTADADCGATNICCGGKCFGPGTICCGGGTTGNLIHACNAAEGDVCCGNACVSVSQGFICCPGIDGVGQGCVAGVEMCGSDGTCVALASSNTNTNSGGSSSSGCQITPAISVRMGGGLTLVAGLLLMFSLRSRKR
jgi:hypothetical protein